MQDRYSSDLAGCEEAAVSIVLFDARSAGLGPAEVLDGVALRLEKLPPGDALLARLPRFPRLLPPQLTKRGLPWEIYEERDRTSLVHVRRPR